MVQNQHFQVSMAQMKLGCSFCWKTCRKSQTGILEVSHSNRWSFFFSTTQAQRTAHLACHRANRSDSAHWVVIMIGSEHSRQTSLIEPGNKFSEGSHMQIEMHIEEAFRRFSWTCLISGVPQITFSHTHKCATVFFCCRHASQHVCVINVCGI